MTPEPYRKLTREDLILGKSAVRDVYFEDRGGTLPLRPLTEGEWSEAQRILLSAINVTGNPEELKKKRGDPKAMKDAVDMKFDMGDLTIAEAKQTAYIVTCGLEFDPKLTIEDVRQISPPGLVEKIAAEILAISQVTPKKKEEIATFRKK